MKGTVCFYFVVIIYLQGASVKGLLNMSVFDDVWNNGLAPFAVRHMNSKRNQVAQTVKLKMFGPISERRHNSNTFYENCGIGLKPYRSTHDDISAWVESARALLPR